MWLPPSVWQPLFSVLFGHLLVNEPQEVFAIFPPVTVRLTFKVRCQLRLGLLGRDFLSLQSHPHQTIQAKRLVYALALLGFLTRHGSSHGALMRRGLAIFQRRNGKEAQFDGTAIEWKAASSATQGSHALPAAVVDLIGGLAPCARFSNTRNQHETKAQGKVRKNRLHWEKVIEIQNMVLTGKIPAPLSPHTVDAAQARQSGCFPS